jgi:hypothetical protein
MASKFIFFSISSPVVRLSTNRGMVRFFGKQGRGESGYGANNTGERSVMAPRLIRYVA